MIDVQARLQAALAGRYTVKREIGRGGMAVVYLAEDVRHQRQVAIKLFDPEVAGAVGHERFLREIQVAANLTHPHILPLYDSGEADGLLYYVMPFIQGETLRDRLRRVGQLSLDEAMRIAREVADGLGYAHHQGLVHRDIKPENVMLASGHALIMDFGISRAVGEAAETTALTRAGLTLGTPTYMSPEQWTAPQRVDGRSDLYSLGCMFHEMLIGEPPFSGATAAVLLARHTQQEVPSLRLIRPDVPDSVDGVVRRAMAKVPEERFATAYDFAEALQTAYTLPAFSIPGLPAASRVTPPAMPVPSEPKKRSFGKPIVWAAGVVLLAAVGYGAYLGLTGGFGGGDDRVRILVLPFDNLGTPDREYFADGLSEEVTARLAGIEGLAVIARTSAMGYKKSEKSIKEIGKELDVAYVIEGSVRCNCGTDRSPTNQDKLKVTLRLYKASDESPVWNYNNDVFLADIFTVQSNIAQEIAGKLNITLQEKESTRLAVTPTSNVEAYDFYLRGNSYYNRSWQRNNVETALSMYEQAVKLDPAFALGMAQLARTSAWLRRLGYDTTEHRLASARAAADSAIALDANLPEAHIALGLYHYWGKWDFAGAVGELEIARKLQPGNALIYQNLGNVQRRLGQWTEAIKNYNAAASLDPRSHIVLYNLAETSLFVRDYDPVGENLDRVIGLAPDFLEGHVEKAVLALKRDGDGGAALRVLQGAMQRVAPSQWRPMSGFWVFGPGTILLEDVRLNPGLAPGLYGLNQQLYHLVRADQARRAGQTQVAHAQFDSARAIIEPLRHRARAEPWIDAELAIAYAGLGRKAEAIATAERAAQLWDRDHFDGPDMVVALARVHAMLGNADLAMENLQKALSRPSRISPKMLQLDPFWAPWRNHPRFRDLLRREPSAVIATDDAAADPASPQ